MGFFNFLKSQLLKSIDWTDSSSNTMVYKYPMEDRDIMIGSKLTVRESQVAVFMVKGKIADVFQPGIHTLVVNNIPIVSSLLSLGRDKKAFTADVFYVNTKQFTNQKWGTTNPITMRDKDFGSIRIRGYGSFAFKVTDAALFLKEVFGTNSTYTSESVANYLKSILVSGISDTIAESKISALDLASNLLEFGKAVKKYFPGRLAGAFYGYMQLGYTPEGSTANFEPLLKSPYIDYLNGTTVGYNLTDGLHRIMSVPLRKYGKFTSIEADIRTHLGGEKQWRCKTPEETRSTVIKVIGNSLFHGCGYHIVDFGKYKDTLKTNEEGNCWKWDTSGKGYYSQQSRARSKNIKMNTVPASGGDKNNIYLGDCKYRKMHPIEAERLQTLPDNYTSCIKSSVKRIGLCGNGWTVDVIAFILSFIK